MQLHLLARGRPAAGHIGPVGLFHEIEQGLRGYLKVRRIDEEVVETRFPSLASIHRARCTGKAAGFGPHAGAALISAAVILESRSIPRRRLGRTAIAPERHGQLTLSTHKRPRKACEIVGSTWFPKTNRLAVVAIVFRVPASLEV